MTYGRNPKRRSLGPLPHLPPWSWLFDNPLKWRSGIRPGICSWCGTRTNPIGPENTARCRSCPTCDETASPQSKRYWKDFHDTSQGDPGCHS